MKATLLRAVTCSLFLCALVLFPLTASAEVQGPQWGIWPGPDTVGINGEVWVPSDSTLIIEPGVVVLFEGHYKFWVDTSATLIAAGTEADSIVFTPADTSTGWHGIRFYSARDACTLSYCRIEYGKATGTGEDTQGGAVFCNNSSPTISGNSISNNSAGDGGGIFCVGNSNPTISQNTINGNSASSSGGGIFCENSSPTINGNAISGNFASDGAGILCYYSSPAISSNIITGNSACFGGNRIGGGINCGNNSNPPISNNAISGNSANYGGGISCNSSSPTVVNTILWEDTAPNGPEIHVFSGGPIVTYCDVQGGWEGEGNIDTLPLFRNPAEGDFHLMAHYCGDPYNSPCIDAGERDSLDAILDCFHGLGTYRADMGAYGGGGIEVPLALTIVPGDTVVVHNDTLSYHVICENGTPDYQSLSFKVNVRLPNGNMYGPIFGPARFGMFGNGISEGDMCHRVPPQAPTGDYWLFAEVYNTEYSAKDSMAFTVTGDGALAGIEPWPRDWQTVVATIGDNDFIGDGVAMGLPTEFALGGNYPNPFNASTVIAYQLPMSGHVTLQVYNLLARRVATLVDEMQEAGYRSLVWDASEVSSGLYFYKLTAGEFTETRRMMLVK